MKSLASYFKGDASFKLRSFISQWWLGVREKWNSSLIDYLLKKISSNMEARPPTGFVNFTEYNISAHTLSVLNKGPKYIPNTLPVFPQIHSVEDHLYKHVIWFVKLFDRCKKNL